MAVDTVSYRYQRFDNVSLGFSLETTRQGGGAEKKKEKTLSIENRESCLSAKRFIQSSGRNLHENKNRTRRSDADDEQNTSLCVLYNPTTITSTTATTTPVVYYHRINKAETNAKKKRKIFRKDYNTRTVNVWNSTCPREIRGTS